MDNSMQIDSALKGSVVGPACNEGENVVAVAEKSGTVHQKALKAGLDHAVGDCVISMDADLSLGPGKLPEVFP